MTRKEIKQNAARNIAASVSEREAIGHGLQIAACIAMSAEDASDIGCLTAAHGIEVRLDALYPDHTMLAHRLARLVARRDWLSLWWAARREVYPESCD